MPLAITAKNILAIADELRINRTVGAANCIEDEEAELVEEILSWALGWVQGSGMDSVQDAVAARLAAFESYPYIVKIPYKERARQLLQMFGQPSKVVAPTPSAEPSTLPTTDIDCCGSCHNFRQGCCHKNPPVRLPRKFVDANSGSRTRDEQLLWNYPKPPLGPEDWCGEFKRAQQKGKAAQ